MLPSQKDSAGTRVIFNGDFYYTESRLGLGGAYVDMENGRQYHLPQNANNQRLGEAVLDALRNNRWLPYLEDYNNLSMLPIAQSYQAEWVGNLLVRYGYKNKTVLYQNMIECGIELKNEQITFSPTKHDALESWNADLRDGFVGVVIPANFPPEEIGKAVRIALSRCLNPYGEKKGLPKHNFDEYIK